MRKAILYVGLFLVSACTGADDTREYLEKRGNEVVVSQRNDPAAGEWITVEDGIKALNVSV